MTLAFLTLKFLTDRHRLRNVYAGYLFVTDTLSTPTTAECIVVFLSTGVDYDTAPTSYSLQIDVSDGTTTKTLNIYITLTAVNEATPNFASNPTTTINENLPAGTSVYTYVASDTDAAPHAIETYAISSGEILIKW